MLREMLELIKFSFENYKGTGMYLAVFFVTVLYLFFKEESKDKKIFFVYYPIIVWFIILNPILAIILSKGFESLTYVRLFWTVPMGIIMAYTATKIVSERKLKSEKVIVIVSVIIIIMASGRCIYHSGNYQAVNNYYKLPDEVLEVTDYILSDDTDYKKLMLPCELVSYIRQINASIELYYGRKSNENYDNLEILQNLNNGEVEMVATMCKENHCNYIIFANTTVLNGNMENYGYELLAQTEHYDIYVLKEEIQG